MASEVWDRASLSGTLAGGGAALSIHTVRLLAWKGSPWSKQSLTGPSVMKGGGGAGLLQCASQKCHMVRQPTDSTAAINDGTWPVTNTT